MIVLDASVGAALVLNSQPLASRAFAHVRDKILVVPLIFEIEVMSAIRRVERAGRIDRARAELAFDAVKGMDVVRWPHTDTRDRVFALRHNLTICDASYVALAEALDVPLLTADAKLAGAPHPHAQIELI